MTDQTNDQSRAHVAEFVAPIAKALEEVFHNKEPRDLTYNLIFSIVSSLLFSSLAHTSIISKDEPAHRDEHAHCQRPGSQEPDWRVIVYSCLLLAIWRHLYLCIGVALWQVRILGMLGSGEDSHGELRFCCSIVESNAGILGFCYGRGPSCSNIYIPVRW